MNVVVYLPTQFYASVASFISEFFLSLNAIRGRRDFSIKFVAKSRRAVSRSGIRFPISRLDSKRIDLLIFLAGHSLDLSNLEWELERDIGFAQRIVNRAAKDGATIAGTCCASLLMARAGLLNRKRATVSWWALKSAKDRFPQVRWNSAWIVCKHKKVYTSGGVYSAMDLLTAVLVDMGYGSDVRKVRKILVSPPVRELQTPYEIELPGPLTEFGNRVDQLVREVGINRISIDGFVSSFGMSPKTLARRFQSELDTTPGKWLQSARIAHAKELLETSNLTINDVCARVGYEDQASFTRLFGRLTGLPPRDYRRLMRI